MATLVLGSPPPELEALIERRRCAGVDHLDEVWLEILSPGDESLQKLPFYAAHDVDEILIVDATDRRSPGSGCAAASITRSSGVD